jgi:hypothetical protein
VVRLSNEAATGHLTCYVRRGMTGTAWFDDVELRQVLDDPIRVEVLSPAYRGWIADAADPIRIRVQLNRADYEYDPQECRIEASLSDGNGRVLQKRSDVAFGSVALGGGIAPLGTAADIQFDPRPLGPGPCVVRTTLRDRGGAQRFTHESELTQATKGLQTAVRFDAHRRLIVDGKPFFPLGMYWAGIKEKDLAVYATSKFNCLMPYFWPSREQMDLAWRHRLRVIYSVKDFYVGTPACPSFIKSEADEEPNVRKYVREFRNHPALLAWYLNDELGEEYLPRLESHCRVEDGK